MTGLEQFRRRQKTRARLKEFQQNYDQIPKNSSSPYMNQKNHIMRYEGESKNLAKPQKLSDSKLAVSGIFRRRKKKLTQKTLPLPKISN